MPVPTLPQNKELIFLSIDNAMKKDSHKNLRSYRGNCMTLITSKRSRMGFAPKFFDIVDVLSNRPQEHGAPGRSRTYEAFRPRIYSPLPLNLLDTDANNKTGASERTRTVNLLITNQLRYHCATPAIKNGAGGRSRTYEDLRLRSYSPRPLASWVPLHSVMKINGQGVRNADFFGDSVLNIFDIFVLKRLPCPFICGVLFWIGTPKRLDKLPGYHCR